ncbi:hypothetical protein CK203_103199 [Vitis vinifera]|uniref:Copia protein n=1 Tax=Vitis vinifera TaxID=29760 RepID=A0A438CI38_VITVI|nr:hypothetical protein CK203_103199 [Vitis vinifera]
MPFCMASYLKKYIWIFPLGMHDVRKAMSEGVQIEEVIVWIEGNPESMVWKVHKVNEELLVIVKWVIGDLHLVTLPLYVDLGYLSRQPIRLFCDNKATCDIAHNPVQHDRTKHVKVDRFFIKKKLDDKIVNCLRFGSED